MDFQLDQFIQNQIVLDSKKIIENHLVDLANKNFKKIATNLNLPTDHIIKCNEFIVSLNPKPGLAYLSSDTSQFITPDIIVKNNGDKFNVSLKNNYDSLKLFNLKKDEINDKDFEIFMETSRMNIEETNTYGDIVFVHDPQPIALVKKKTQNKWIWRCHIDVSNPHERV